MREINCSCCEPNLKYSDGRFLMCQCGGVFPALNSNTSKTIEWISVDERLPSEYQRVLVGRAGSLGVFGLIAYRKNPCSGKYWSDSACNIFAAPTHWAEITDITK